jgi:hypothetical protein
MKPWLEKFNSLTQGMLFTGGYLSPASVAPVGATSSNTTTSVKTISVTSTESKSAEPRGGTVICRS